MLCSVHRTSEVVIHLPIGLTTEEFACYTNIDNDVVISADRRWRRRWDLSRLCRDTGCGIWQKRVGRRHDDTAVDSSYVQGSRQTLAAPASRTPYKVHARCVRIWRPTGVWTTADGGCVLRREGVGLNGARWCAHTPLKRTIYWRL